MRRREAADVPRISSWRGDSTDRGRPSEEEALCETNAERAKHLALGIALHPLSHELGACLEHVMVERGDQGLAGGVGVDVPHEREIELRERWFQLHQMAEAGERFADVVDRKTDVRPELVDRVADRPVVADRLLLRQLDDDRPMHVGEQSPQTALLEQERR